MSFVLARYDWKVALVQKHTQPVLFFICIFMGASWT